MNVTILELLDGARQARGLTVVIDVFRAFSLEAWLFARGAEKIYAVGGADTALQLKACCPDAVLAGERGGKILPGFDFGNSPSQTADFDWRGKSVIHTTSAGTQGLTAAGAAQGVTEILTGSIVNAGAIARFIAARQPEYVSLVAMGWNGKESSPEDLLCARLIKARLNGMKLDWEREISAVRAHPQGAKFFNPETQDVFPRKDFDMCLDLDRFDFVIRALPCASFGPADVFQMVCEKA